MIKKFVTGLLKNPYKAYMARPFSTVKEDAPKEEKKQNKKEQQKQEDNEEFEDYGEFKVRKGGRTLKIEEEAAEEDAGYQQSQQTSPFSIAARVVAWSSFGYWLYQYYEYKTQPNYKAENPVDSFFLEGVKYVDASYRKFIDIFTKPFNDKLLPDIPTELMPPGMQYPKCLMINLSGTLITQQFEMGKSREVLKRPGFDELIKHFAQDFEIIVFSDDDGIFVSSLREKMDPTGQYIRFTLGHEAMAIDSEGRYKDLTYVNRDPKRIIVLESKPERIRKHEENGLFIPEFSGDQADKELYKIFPLLKHLAQENVQDVRSVLKKYGKFNAGDEFIKELEERKKQLAQSRGRGLGSFLGEANRKSPNYMNQEGKNF